MSEPKYRIDDQGNLVEDGRGANGSGAQSGSETDEEAPITPEQARSTMRALVLGEVLGVLMLLGGAVYYEEQRALLLVAAAVYAVFAIFAARYLRRSIYKRVDSPLT